MNPVERCDAIVIGAGVVGCAVAYELGRAGLAAVVCEQGPRIAEGVTSRNSGVIHAGIYYHPASLKAQSCVRGCELLYEWCARKSVSHRRVGKWIVASKSETDELEAIYANAIDSGARRLSLCGPDRLRTEAPYVKGELAILSEGTGIVDPFEYSRSLQVAAEGLGASFVMNAAVTAIERGADGYRVATTRGELEAGVVVNAAGLNCDDVARLAGIGKYRIHPCRGDYFRVRLPYPAARLIYPVKKRGAPGLGVHLTLSLDGSCRLGPDTEYVTSKADFAAPIDCLGKKRAFYDAASKYLEGLRPEQLEYDSCGLRPKLRSPAEREEKDFVVSQDLPGFINLVGIESPGLTASLDLADRVVRLLY